MILYSALQCSVFHMVIKLFTHIKIVTPNSSINVVKQNTKILAPKVELRTPESENIPKISRRFGQKRCSIVFDSPLENPGNCHLSFIFSKHEAAPDKQTQTQIRDAFKIKLDLAFDKGQAQGLVLVLE